MPLFPFLKRKNAPDREPVGMASPAEQVQAARVRARRRLIGAVVLLGVGIVGFPLLFETQPRPLPVDVTIEIPRKDGGAPLVLPSRVSPITETADEAGREVAPPAAAPASAPAIRPVTPAPAVAETRPAPAASAAPTVAPATKASAPIRVLADPPRSSVTASSPRESQPVRDLAKEREAREKELAAREAREAKEKAAREAREREAAREREVAAREAKEAKERAAREAKEREAAREREVAAREAKEAKDKAAREAREREAAREAVAREALRDRSSESVEKRYIVQVGAFADATAAGEARARVEKLGIRTFTQVVETDAGRRIRVRVGPFASREEADKALGKLKAAGLPTALLPL